MSMNNRNHADHYFCKSCQTWKHKDDWYYTKGKVKPVRDCWCKECRKAYRKDAKRLHSKQYYVEHRGHYLELHRKWREENLEHKLWLSCKHNAKKRGLEFSIDDSDIVIPEFCPVFGIALDTNAETGKDSDKNKSWKNPNRPSVDRIDNTKGYIKGNIQVISWRANSIKKDATLEEIKLLYEHLLTLSQE